MLFLACQVCGSDNLSCGAVIVSVCVVCDV